MGRRARLGRLNGKSAANSGAYSIMSARAARLRRTIRRVVGIEIMPSV
jgi:hypothetical protein